MLQEYIFFLKKLKILIEMCLISLTNLNNINKN